MQYIATIFGIIFAGAMFILYGAAAIAILEKAYLLIITPIGIKILSIIVSFIVVYVISSGIKERGFIGNIKALVYGRVKLWHVYWIYFICVTALFTKIIGLAVDKMPQHIDIAACIIIFIHVMACYIAIITAIKQKESLILWRGMVFLIALLGLICDVIGVYSSINQGVSLGDAVFSGGPGSIGLGKISVYRDTVESLLN